MKTIKFRSSHYDHKNNFYKFTEWGIFEDEFKGKTHIAGCVVKTDEMFTGVHDIKKNPIYAGDVLKVGENLMGIVEYIDRNVDDYGDEISAAFHFNIPSQDKTIPFDYYMLNNCTVIGNIHENSELCKII